MAIVREGDQGEDQGKEQGTDGPQVADPGVGDRGIPPLTRFHCAMGKAIATVKEYSAGEDDIRNPARVFSQAT